MGENIKESGFFFLKTNEVTGEFGYIFRKQVIFVHSFLVM